MKEGYLALKPIPLPQEIHFKQCQLKKSPELLGGWLQFWYYVRTSLWLSDNHSLHNFLNKFQMTHYYVDQFSGQPSFVLAQPASPLLVLAHHSFLDNYSNPLVFMGAANQSAPPSPLTKGLKHMTQTMSIRHSSCNLQAYHQLQSRQSSPGGTRFYSSLYL